MVPSSRRPTARQLEPMPSGGEFAKQPSLRRVTELDPLPPTATKEHDLEAFMHIAARLCDILVTSGKRPYHSDTADLGIALSVLILRTRAIADGAERMETLESMYVLLQPLVEWMLVPPRPWTDPDMELQASLAVAVIPTCVWAVRMQRLGGEALKKPDVDDSVLSGKPGVAETPIDSEDWFADERLPAAIALLGDSSVHWVVRLAVCKLLNAHPMNSFERKAFTNMMLSDPARVIEGVLKLFADHMPALGPGGSPTGDDCLEVADTKMIGTVAFNLILRTVRSDAARPRS